MPARLQAHENNRSVVLDKPILFVGRHPECDLVINHSRKVSRKHCCLAEINGQFMVRDLGSTNGVQVNGRRVTGTKELNNGDELIIGDCLYTFYDGSISPEEFNAQFSHQARTPGHVSDNSEIAHYPVDADELTKKEAPVDLEHRSPQMHAESEEDGFDVHPGEHVTFRRREGFIPPRRSREGSDSHLEMSID